MLHFLSLFEHAFVVFNVKVSHVPYVRHLALAIDFHNIYKAQMRLKIEAIYIIIGHSTVLLTTEHILRDDGAGTNGHYGSDIVLLIFLKHQSLRRNVPAAKYDKI